MGGCLRMVLGDCGWFQVALDGFGWFRVFAVLAVTDQLEIVTLLFLFKNTQGRIRDYFLTVITIVFQSIYIIDRLLTVILQYNYRRINLRGSS